MWNTAGKIAAVALILGFGGCAGMSPGDAIMQTAPGDPTGSANIGTGSVTVNSMVPQEAKSAGIGLGP